MVPVPIGNVINNDTGKREIIEIPSSDDEVKNVEPKITRINTNNTNTNTNTGIFDFSVARIGIGEKVYAGEGCGIQIDIKNNVMCIEYKIPPKKLTKRQKVMHSNSNKDDNNNFECKKHIIHPEDIIESKFYTGTRTEESEDNLIIECEDEDDDDNKNLESSFLALRVAQTESNMLDQTTADYDPECTIEKDDVSRKYIVVELFSKHDFQSLIQLMQKNTSFSGFVDETARIVTSKLVQQYGATLIADNVSDIQHVKLPPVFAYLQESDIIVQYPFDVARNQNVINQIDQCDMDLTYRTGTYNAIDSSSSTSTTLPSIRDGRQEGNDSDNKNYNDNNNNNNVNESSISITVRDFKRLNPKIYLNDSLIDFWCKWIWRNVDSTYIHVFTSQFYTYLEANGTKDPLKWTETRRIDIFSKKFIFIPINQAFHWSLCIVINPGFIMDHINTLEEFSKSSQNDTFEKHLDKPFPCILFMDPFKAHAKNVVGEKIRTWLNDEWSTRNKDKKLNPFTMKTMRVNSPVIPYQNNTWDCGVFVCRYVFSMFKLISQNIEITYRNSGHSGKVQGQKYLFKTLITKSTAFKFGMNDIDLLRKEMKQLLVNLYTVLKP